MTIQNTARDFARFGFEKQIVSERTFNVVCVTKRNWQTGVHDFHFPITGEAKVTAMLETAPNEVVMAHTEVEFQGRKNNLAYVRNGLFGDALVIGISNFEDQPYNVWELYTDTPSAAPDYGGTPTPEELRERAERESSEASRRRTPRG